MGVNLTTTIVSPVIVAAGGQVTGNLTVTSPGAGNFYLMMEQYTGDLTAIPGSRAYLDQAIAGGSYVNSTTLVTTRTRAAAGVIEAVAAVLTVQNTNCYTYIYLMQRTSNVVAGAFAIGTTYEIMSVGTTDFTLIGATANTVGLTFTATGVGVGTGIAAELPSPTTDTEIDHVVITLQETSTDVSVGIDLGEIMNLMITMMIVMMMMKMMMGIMSSVD